MAQTRAQRRLAAVLAADIVGYSRMIEAHEAATLDAIKALRAEIFDPLLVEYNGRIIKLMGDGALVEFGSVVDAVACAVALQKQIAARQAELPPARRIVYRIGINLGDVVVENDDLFGDGVNVAARLEQLCPPGGVLVSGTAYDQLKGKLSLPLVYLGEQPVKNLSHPVRTYSVKMEGAGSGWRLKMRPIRRRFVPIAAGIVLLLLLAAGGVWWFRSAEPTLTKSSIAVLPFDNFGRDEATGRLADGITEDIITDLARFPDFSVIARNSTAVYAGKPVDVRQVGKDLNVRYVLEGSVQRQGEAIRVTAQLIDASNGAHVWSERWDRPAKDIFAVQTEIVQQAVNRLGGSGVIMEAENRAAQRKRPANLGAYETYLLGRDRILTPTKERIDEAIALFKSAIEKDTTLARAWVDLAWAYDQSTGYGADYATAHPLALAAARRAVELDPMDAGAHSVLGTMLGEENNFSEAKAELEIARRLNPGSSDILAQYAGWASTFGDPQGGADAADRAIHMNPNYPVGMTGFFGYAYFMAGRYEDALRIQLREPAEGRSRDGWMRIASSLAALARSDEAKAAVRNTLARFPDLTIEGFANQPGYSDAERQKFVTTMKAAGFPPCAPPEKLTNIDKPVRLPECTNK